MSKDSLDIKTLLERASIPPSNPPDIDVLDTMITNRAVDQRVSAVKWIGTLVEANLNDLNRKNVADLLVGIIQNEVGGPDARQVARECLAVFKIIDPDLADETLHDSLEDINEIL